VNNRDEVVAMALRRVGLLIPGERPSAGDLKDFNLILTSIMAQIGISVIQDSAIIPMAKLLVEEISVELRNISAAAA
jgi:hypothetical protein